MTVGVGNLDRGAIAGRETKIYYDSVVGSYSDPPTEDEAWVEITRARNVSISKGRQSGDVEMHGEEDVASVPGYRVRTGSFEYVRRRGTDSVYTKLKTAQDNGDALYLRIADGDITTSGTAYDDGPFILGESEETKNGNDPVVETFNFMMADVFDYNGEKVVITSGTVA